MTPWFVVPGFLGYVLYDWGLCRKCHQQANETWRGETAQSSVKLWFFEFGSAKLASKGATEVQYVSAFSDSSGSCRKNQLQLVLYAVELSRLQHGS